MCGGISFNDKQITRLSSRVGAFPLGPTRLRFGRYEDSNLRGASAATCSSARDAPISAAASRPRATSARLPAGAPLGTGSTGHAVLGGSDASVTVYPGDWAVALAAFDAEVDVLGPGGRRTIPLEELHREPAATPHIETTLTHDELILRIATGRRLRDQPIRIEQLL